MQKNSKTTQNLWQKSVVALVFLLAIRDARAELATAMQNVSCIAHDTKFTCDCRGAQQLMQLPRLNGYVYQVEITNCPSLEIEANALTDTQGLRKLTFGHVDNLVLHKYALAFPRYASNTALIIEFHQVGIKLIDSHAIDGNIEELSFNGGHIDTIRPFGFATIKEHAALLQMHGVRIRRIETQAFKKFTVNDMAITNCIFEQNLPSKAFYELEVTNSFRLLNNTFKEVHTHALTFTSAHKLSIASNTFSATDAEWLKANVKDSASITDNIFGNVSAIAFHGIHLHRDYQRSEPLELKFYNNIVTSPHKINALEFDDRISLNLRYLFYENAYDCSNLDRTQQSPVPSTEFFQRNVEHIYFLNNAPGAQDQRFLVLSKIIATDCAQRSYLGYIVGGAVGVVLIVIAVIVVVCVAHARRDRKRRKLELVVPEPRTYTETQIVYQIENAGLLKTDL